MLKSWSILLLSAFMVLQLALAFPQREISKSTELRPNAQPADKELNTPRNQLLHDTLALLTKQSKIILIESRKFLKDFVKEVKALPDKSAGIEKNITRLNEVLKQIDAIDFNANPPMIDEMFTAVDELGKVYDDFYGMPESKDPTSDVVILEKLFEKVGSEGLEQRLENSLNATLDDFKKTFETFEKSLSNKEKQKEAKLLEWYGRFAAENETEKKFNLLEEFWAFFN